MIGTLDKLKIHLNSLLEDQTIKDIQEWKIVMNDLADNKFIQLNEIELIEKNLLIFPMQIDHFLTLVFQYFKNTDYMDLEYLMQEQENKINYSKCMIQHWSTIELKPNELQILIKIFEELKTKQRSCQSQLDELYKEVKNQKENTQQLRDLLDIEQNEVVTAQQYQNSERLFIEREYTSQRVKDVQYRNQSIKVLEISSLGVIKQLGYCVDIDQPVEVTKVPHDMVDIQEREIISCTMNAHKELLQSQYFQNFRGYNLESDPDYSLYFLEYFRGISLKELLKYQKIDLLEHGQMFYYQMRMLFKAFKDILDTTTYVPENIEAEHVALQQEGLKIVLKGLRFSQQRDPVDNSHEIVEARLLVNLGQLLIGILGFKNSSQIPLKVQLGNELRSFVDLLLDAETEYVRYIGNPKIKRVTFQMLSNHPYIDDKYQVDVNIVDVVNQYQSLLDSMNKVNKQIAKKREKIKQQTIQRQINIRNSKDHKKTIKL